jgi:tRNA modification GTPase
LAVQTLKVVIGGRPNAGKSSLFNALAGQRLALVADRPGVTRDYLETELDLDGLKCRLIDTAGLQTEGGKGDGRREKGDNEADDCEAVGAMAGEIAARQRAAADVIIYCIDATRAPDEHERLLLDDDSDGRRIVVLTKCDFLAVENCQGATAGRVPSGCGSAENTCGQAPRGALITMSDRPLATSSPSGAGLDVLRKRLRAACLAAQSAGAEAVAGTANRCRQSLRLAVGAIKRAAAVDGQAELAAEEIRAALDALGRVVGAVYSDDLLERVFSRFCIGK